MSHSGDTEKPVSTYSKLEDHQDGSPLTPVLDLHLENGSIDSSAQLHHGSTDSEKSPLHLNQKSSSSPCAGDGLKAVIIAGVTFSIAVTIAMVIHILLGPGQVEPHGAVSCNVKQCSEVGVDILKRKGHAVDAAIATMLCVGVVNAESSGIGGGGFMLVKTKKSVEAIDFRETAPADSTEDMFRADATLAKKGGLAVAVPGELHGMYTAWKKYGKIPWSELFTPTINLATNGFKVTEHTEKAVEKHYPDMTEGLKEIYAPDGVKVKADDDLTRPDLARTLGLIASEGIDAFYDGNLTDNIIYTVKASGGILTRADLQSYQAIAKTSLETKYHDYIVHGVPVPSGGPVFMSIINILEGYNFTRADRGQPLTYHRIIEAFKYAFAQETELGDPNFVDNATDMQNIMLSKSSAQVLRNLINDNTTYAPSHYGPYIPSSSQGTAHISVIDNDDNMVSVTTTVNHMFGSKVITPDGIILNNEMDDFTWPEKQSDLADAGLTLSKANYVAPGKRPLSSTTPVIVYNEKDACLPRFAIGGTNGTRIGTGVAEVFLNLLSLGVNTISGAVEESRLHHHLVPNEVEVEDGVSAAVVSGLESRGHTVVKVEPLSSVFGVLKAKDRLSSHADSRTPGSGSLTY